MDGIEIEIQDEELLAFGESLEPELMDDDDVVGGLKTYIGTEIQLALSERQDQERYWKRWTLQRMARPEKDSKNFPWPDAANHQSPELMAKVNTVFAALVAKYESKKPFWKVMSLQEENLLMAQAVEEALNILAENPHMLDLKNKTRHTVYETVSLGNCFVKGLWQYESHNFRRKNGEQVTKVRHNGPEIRVIAIEDFLTRAAFTDLDRAPWYAIRTSYFDYELKKLEREGVFRNVDMICSQDQVPGVQGIQQDRQGQKPMVQNGEGVYEIWEVTMFWDVDGDGVDEDITVFYHEDSGTVLRIDFAELSVRDVIKFDYLSLPHSLYGMGLCAMGDGTQQAISSYLNMASNSTALHSLQMTIEREGSGSQKRELFPGGTIIVDDPINDIRPFVFPNTAPQAMAMKADAQRDLNTATGTNPAMGGQPDTVMKSRFSLGGYQAQASMGTSMTEIISQNMDQSFSKLGMLLTYIMVANGEQSKQIIMPLLPEMYQEAFGQVMDLKVEDIPIRFDFVVRSTAVDETRDSQRQKYMFLNQIHDQYTPRIIQYMIQAAQLSAQAQQTGDPMMAEAVKFIWKMIAARSKLTDKTFEFLGVEDSDQLVNYYQDILLMSGVQEQQKDQQVKEIENGLKTAGMSNGSARELPVPGGAPGAAGNGAGANPSESGISGGSAGGMGASGEMSGPPMGA